MLNKKCPSQNELPSFLNGGMSPAMRNEAEVHLSNCSHCRREISGKYLEDRQSAGLFDSPSTLIDTAKKIASDESGDGDVVLPVALPSAAGGWQSMRTVKVVFASCVLVFGGILGVYFLQPDNVSGPDDPFRNASTSAEGIDLLSPGNEEVVVGQSIRFVWKNVEGVKSYSLIFSDEKGDIVGEFTTEKTSIEGPISDFGLLGQRKYFWHISAKLPDGSRVESEFRKIVIRK